MATVPTGFALIGELKGQSVEFVLDQVPQRDGDIRVRVATDPDLTEVSANEIRRLCVIAR